MDNKQRNDAFLILRLPKQMKEVIEAYAKQLKISVSAAVRQLLSGALDI